MEPVRIEIVIDAERLLKAALSGDRIICHPQPMFFDPVIGAEREKFDRVKLTVGVTPQMAPEESPGRVESIAPRVKRRRGKAARLCGHPTRCVESSEDGQYRCLACRKNVTPRERTDGQLRYTHKGVAQT